MENDKMLETIKRELYDIARRKGSLLKQGKNDNKTALKIISDFMENGRGEIHLHRNLMFTLQLLANFVVSDTISKTLQEITSGTGNRIVLKLYLYMQMSNNFLDGFLLGQSFIKIQKNLNIMAKSDFNTLDIFKKMIILRQYSKEDFMVEMLEEETGLISHFKKTYEKLFSSNNLLLENLEPENMNTVIQNLTLTFLDGILSAKIIFDSITEENNNSKKEYN